MDKRADGGRCVSGAGDVATSGRSRREQPTRVRTDLGTRHRTSAGAERDLAVSPHRARVRRTGRGGAGVQTPRRDRADHRPALFRHQTGLAARPHAQWQNPRGRGRNLLRHGGRLGAVELDRRCGPCLRRVQRRPHAVVQSAYAAVGPGPARPLWPARRGAAHGATVELSSMAKPRRVDGCPPVCP